MRPTVEIAALLLLVAAPAMGGAGVSLRWFSCFPDTASRWNRSFACDTNVGAERVVGSFQIGQIMPEVTGNEIVVDLHTGRPWSGSSTPLPEWWRFRNAGSCRASALAVALIQNPELEPCPDWSAGQAVGGIGAYVVGIAGPGTARIIMASAVPQASAAFLTPDVEYFSFTLIIRHDKTVGTEACAGCEVPMTLILNSVNVTTPVPAEHRRYSGPVNGTDSNYVVWSPTPVPTRRSTWGAVKSLYH